MKSLLFLFLPLVSCGQNKTDKFVVHGSINFFGKTEKIYLEYNSFEDSGLVTHTDSALIKTGAFTFDGFITEPSKASIYCYLSGSSGLKSSLSFFLSKGETTITIKGNLESGTVTGTDVAVEFSELKQMAKRFNQKELSLADSLIVFDFNNDEEGIERVRIAYSSLQIEFQNSVYIPFFLKHLNSAVGIYALERVMENNINDPEKIISLYSQLSPKAKKLQSAVQLEKKLEGLKRTSIGTQALDFTMPDAQGNYVSLSSFKGKYVLVDFWASWCIPCRAEAPNLVAVFSKYHKKGFTILGVALEKERDREKWLKAIKQDKLTWTQVTDFKYWENAAIKQYYVNAIPFNFLLDPQGKVIARNLRGSELNETLSKLFK